MIIRHLHIDNFGCFHNFDLELKPGLNRLQWKNEGGKSTLLEFIRRIFWGFPDKRSRLNPYPALNGSGHYGGFLDVITKDGQNLRLERRGERGKLKIIYPDGSSRTEENIGALTGVEESFYLNVCAITIDELTGVAALDSREIRNRLYGKALSGGSISLSQLQQQLTAQAEMIFKKRGISNELKSLSDGFEKSAARLEQLSQAMPDYEKAVLNAEALEKEAGCLKGSLQQLFEQIRQCENALETAQKHTLLAADEARFEQLPRPEALPEAPAPFHLKHPEQPAEPVFSEMPPPPAMPDASHLEGRCAPLHARLVDQAVLTAVGAWQLKDQQIKLQLKRGKGCLLAMALLVCTAGVAASLLKSIVLGVCLAAGAIAAVCYYAKWLKRNALSQKEKENFFYSYQLSPHLSAEELLPVLLDLMTWQKEMELFQQQQSEFEAQKQTAEKLRFEYSVKLDLYKEALSHYEKAQQDYEAERLAYEKLCLQRSEALARYESEKLALIRRRNELPPQTDVSSAPEDLENLKERAQQLQEKIEKTLQWAAAERRTAQMLLDGRDCAVEINVREQHRGNMRSAAERYLVLLTARTLLERTIERCEKEHQPALLQTASRYFGIFTENVYTRVYKHLETNTLRVGNLDKKTDKALNELSRGTREQLFLALRLALIISFEKETEPLSIVLDDILVNFDNSRKEAALKVLEDFAADRQVLLLECN